MTELPAVNSLLYVAVNDEVNFRTRVESIDGEQITIAAPIGAGDLDIPVPGSSLTVFWLGRRVRVVLLVRMIAVTRDRPVRWTVEAAGEPHRITRRQFVRGGGDGHVRITSMTGDKAAVDATLLDISEGGLRCRVQAGALDPGDQIIVRTYLSDTRIEVPGRVLATRRDAEEGGLDLVVTFTPPEPVAAAIRRHIMAWEIAERRRAQDVEG